ncbi:MAG: hypothetical protein WDZ35_11035 [Crocinitomicaceae bacterium]
MSGSQAVLIVLFGGLFLGLITGLIVRQNGYSFKRYFITGFLAGAGILGIIVKIIRDYL